MRLRVTDAAGVWLTEQGGKATFFHGNEDGSCVVQCPDPRVAVVGNAPIHVKLSILKWRNNRYELGGGLILAIGFPGVHGLSPRSPNRIWDLKANPFVRNPEFVPHILTQSEPNQEWFAARPVPCATSRVTMVEKWCRFAVWDVTSTYAKIATRIIQNMNSVAHSFKPNPAVGLNCIGFDRRSELRVDFPAFATPGHRIPEICAVDMSPETWAKVVRAICTMCGVASSILDETTHKAGITDAVHVNIMEALFTGALGLCGAYTGWDCEQVDDTSIPDQKLGYNSDCEDQAIKVLGVFKKITHASRYLEDTDWWFANHLAKFGREYFDYGVLLTGMACPSVALHSDKPAIDKQIGHAWCALRRNPLKFKGYPVDWAFVEGTAVALSYRPLKSSKFASTPESICHSAFAGKIMLISPPKKLAMLKSSLNFPTLATIDDSMNYLKYITVASMTDESKGSMICVKKTARVGVPAIDFLREKSRDTLPVISSFFDEMYTDHFGDFSMVDIPSPVVPSERRFSKMAEGAFRAHIGPLHGVMAFSALDVNRYHGGVLSFVSDGMKAVAISLPMNDIVIVGYPEREDFPSQTPPLPPQYSKVSRVPKRSTVPRVVYVVTSGAKSPQWSTIDAPAPSAPPLP